jgi:hypothetical protein
MGPVDMIERHTIDFARVSFNIVSDADRGTITLQFAQTGGRRESIQEILRAIHRRFGGGVMSRLNRWSTGESNSFVLPKCSKPHPDYPDVICFEIGVRPGARMEAVLARFLDFLRQLPGYQRTYGSPLDRDEVPSRVRTKSPHDVSTVADATLREFFKRRTKPSADQ